VCTGAWIQYVPTHRQLLFIQAEGIFIDREVEKRFHQRFQTSRDSVEDKTIQTMVKAFRRDVSLFFFIYFGYRLNHPFR
jgi:hypothetical protein